MKNFITVLLSSLFIVYSCNKDKQTTDSKKSNTSKAIQKESARSKTQQKASETRKEPSDFVSNEYEIQYDAEGDLNQDGLADMALVLRKKTDTLAQRKMLVLLKNPDKTYRLDKISETVLPDEYNEYGYKMHDPEDISIEKGVLNIKLYDIGPYGNQFSTFRYMKGNLILTYIETYNMGAGSHSALYYEPLKGKVVEETINTMKEDMPASTETFKVKKEIFLFEKASPDDIIRKVYDSITHE
ncbi:hypothetical protein HX13_20970 [Chryseobacterium sp. P1-3]|uniref:hypothetical protein n=1 Tax=Chryseobacterium sp. (strain P1-3) TaxID=1517683 RepID=UPI0004E6723F|nr:hypothetical protein [Chryseobacterium sp. P1-3]KFF73330.1 hypothetical protein HX13_20970 [Chryseobacterium sp. P1-3]